ncbi:MAG: sensor histidine kinase [Candidatus Dormibacteraceae bacterium]
MRLLASFRLWLVLTMLGTALVSVVLTSVVVARVASTGEGSGDRAKARQMADLVARRAGAGAAPEELRTLQSLLPTDQLIVFRGGSQVFVGPARASPLEFTISVRSGDARVILRDHASGLGPPTLELVLVAAIPSLLVIGAAIVVATILSRAVQSPIERAIEVADRIAGGDFAVRMGAAGPEELIHLGRAFDSMAERLESADGSQRRFLADLGHEIATPINTISGFGLALADGSLATADERSEARLVLRRETERLRSLLEDLRRLTRLDLAQTVSRERLDVAHLCAGVAARFAADARSREVSLTVAATSISILSDRRLLEMVLGNLVSNAVRYTPQGGAVRIAAGRRGDRAVISVRDTGIGIPAEHQQRIFDRFYRVDEARARATGGSGLGLSIALRAARSLDAGLELDSAPGRGSEFRLTLPTELR